MYYPLNKAVAAREVQAGLRRVRYHTRADGVSDGHGDGERSSKRHHNREGEELERAKCVFSSARLYQAFPLQEHSECEGVHGVLLYGSAPLEEQLERLVPLGFK